MTHRDPANSPTHKGEAVVAALSDLHEAACETMDALITNERMDWDKLERATKNARAALAEDRPDSAATEQEAAEQMDNGRNTGGKSYHRAEPTELQQLFDLQWEADQRAVKLWREANPGNDLVMPGRCDLVVWLLNKFATPEDRPALPADDAVRVNLMKIEGTAISLINILTPRGAEVGHCVDRLNWIIEYARAALTRTADDRTGAAEWKDELMQLFRDHYWHSFEDVRELVLKHVESVLAMYTRATPSPTLGEALDGETGGGHD